MGGVHHADALQATGLQALVHTNDHPPPHFHLLLDDAEVRLEWPRLEPLKGDRRLSRKERKRLDSYLSEYGREIEEKINLVYRASHG